MIILLFCLLALLLWLFADLYFGRRYFLSIVKKHNFPERHGTVELFSYGDGLYDQIFSDIQNAEHHIHILFFIIRDDAISHRFCNLLKEKSEQGVEVRLMIDRIGGNEVKRDYIATLKKSGVSFAYTQSVRFPFLFFSLNQRNHRKIVVIDGKIGYLGGFNIGEEYRGKNVQFGMWRDYHLRFEDDGVQDLQTQFLYDWAHASKENLLCQKKLFPSLAKGDVKLRFVTTNGAYLEQSLMDLISTAKNEIFIGSPYFVPESKLFQLLLTKLAEGVRIRILVPQKPDHPIVFWGAWPYLKTLVENGAMVFLYRDGFYHGKTLLIDDEVCDIGTANFDLRSLFLNFEMNCLIYCPHFIETFKENIADDWRKSNEIGYRFFYKPSLKERAFIFVATLFRRFL
ncbi:MAG: cardiolipin synthase [Bacilli bacterium]